MPDRAAVLQPASAGEAGPPDAGQLEVIFVVGSSRSGTTMMGRLLGRHDTVFTFHELHFFEHLWSERDPETLEPAAAQRLLAELISVQRQGYLTEREPALFRAEAARLLGDEQRPTPRDVFGRFLRTEAARQMKRVPCDQTPRNLFYLREIFDWYPRARVINMIRDPRDVMLSQKNKWRRRALGGSGIPLRESLRARLNYHPLTVAKLWVSAVRAGERHAGESRLLSVRFDRLAAEPQSVVAEVCRFLGLDYSAAMLDIPHKGSSLRADDENIRGIDPLRAGSWRRGGLSAAEIYLCERVAGGAMQRCGFEAAQVSPGWVEVAAYLAIFPLHLLLALLVNLSRVRSLGNALRRRFG